MKLLIPRQLDGFSGYLTLVFDGINPGDIIQKKQRWLGPVHGQGSLWMYILYNIRWNVRPKWEADPERRET